MMNSSTLVKHTGLVAIIALCGALAPQLGCAADSSDAADQTSELSESVISPPVPCRLVTASSIPVFTSQDGSAVLCRFLHGDRFSSLGSTQPFGRFITWCPRGVPVQQGTTGFAQVAGTTNC
jgi:hypothetical protein